MKLDCLQGSCKFGSFWKTWCNFKSTFTCRAGEMPQQQKQQADSFCRGSSVVPSTTYGIYHPLLASTGPRTTWHIHNTNNHKAKVNFTSLQNTFAYTQWVHTVPLNRPECFSKHPLSTR